MVIAICFASLVTLAILFLIIIPRSVDKVYEVVNEKVAREENAVMHSARSITEGIQEVAAKFDLAVDKSTVEIIELKNVDSKIIGRVKNNSDSMIYRIQVSIVVKDEVGALKDVISESAKGFGSLSPGETEYFYMELDDFTLEDGDKIEGSVVQAMKSFLKVNAKN